MSEEPVLFTREGAIARITLNRPDVGNAIHIPLAQAFMHAATQCDEDETIRCVILDANGRLFCAGGDVPAMAGVGEDIGKMLKEVTSYLHIGIARLSRMNKPLITAVQGPAAGAGFSLAVLGDIAIAGQSAHFTIAYPGVGLSPDGGATWLLPRLVGMRRAQEIFLLNKRVLADEAAEIGLVTRVAPDADLKSTVDQIAAQFAVSATGALGATRRLLQQSFGASLETQMESETREIAMAGRSPHGREGLSAVAAKRKPNFD